MEIIKLERRWRVAIGWLAVALSTALSTMWAYWDPQLATASYNMPPDKESPLWNVHSKVIYWWTATEVDDRTAYIIVYDGKAWPRKKLLKPGYLAFRAVRAAG